MQDHATTTSAAPHRRPQAWVLRGFLVFLVLVLVSVAGLAGVAFLGPKTMGLRDATITGPKVAVGGAFPQVTGQDFTHADQRIDAASHPAVILVVAHWCHFCQGETQLLAGATKEQLPSQRLYLIPTWFMWPLAWPPQDRLHAASFPGTVIVDPGSTVANKLGLGGVPEWFFTNASGVVVARHQGSLSLDELRTLADQAKQK